MGIAKSDQPQKGSNEMEGIIEALRNEETGTIKGASSTLLLRLREAEEQLKQHRDFDYLVKEQTRELEKTNSRLKLDLSRRQQTETELRAMLRRIFQAQEEERKQIARNLHDEIGQQLTVLSLLLDRAARPANRLDAATLLAEARQVVQELIGEVRSLSLDLRPSILDDLGLVPTLLWYFGHYTQRTQISVDFHHSNLTATIPIEISISAYRIVQEALTNVARHARVNHVDINAWAQDNVLFIRIRDKGLGFRVESVANSSGLSSMKERAHYLGGELSIGSEPGEGTCITAKLPISRAGI